MRPHCNKCRIATPYAGLADALKARGFVDGTIIALSRHDAGNFRRCETVPKIAEELERLKATPEGAAERIEVPWQPTYR
jgi:hypothetical protein